MTPAEATAGREAGVCLSVVIRLVGGEPFLRRCLGHLVPRVTGRPGIEILVPYDATCGSLEGIRAAFPSVCFLDMGVVAVDGRPGTLAAMHELYDRRTSHGLATARGEIVALLEDFGAPAADWCEQVLAAHRLPHGVIGGAVEHEARALLNWAVYFLDFGRYQLPLPEGPAAYLTDVNVSYKREALDLVPETWRERYNEVTVHWALLRRGVTLWLRPQIIVRQHRGRLSFGMAVAERLAWGRVFGARRAREISGAGRVVYVAVTPAIPFLLLSRLVRRVVVAGRHRRQLVLALPLIAVLTCCWCLGELIGYATGREGAA